MKWRTGLLATAVALSAAVVAPTAASAAKTITSGTRSCTIEALAPKLTVTTKGRTLTGSARVWCTMSTTVSVRLSVGEIDINAEQIVIAETARSVSVRASTVSRPTWVTVSTSTITCPNTETGNEEFRSNARISLGTITSDYDRTIPTIDQFAC